MHLLSLFRIIQFSDILVVKIFLPLLLTFLKGFSSFNFFHILQNTDQTAEVDRVAVVDRRPPDDRIAVAFVGAGVGCDRKTPAGDAMIP
jgi:hypothetical protein